VKLKYFILLSFLICFWEIKSQTILTYEEYINNVRKHHPIAQQANIIVSNANANLLRSKSAFDPQISGNYEAKKLKAITYFNNNDLGVKMNTRSPISVSVGYDDNSGGRLNPDVTSGTISYLGASLPLLKGLLIDERRADLKQANLIVGLSEVERKLAYNNLILDASIAYVEWLTLFNELQIVNQYINNVEQRVRLTAITFENGDKSLADTIEIFTQLQSFRLQRSTLLQEYINAQLQLSFYLWNGNGDGYLIDDGYIPDITFLDQIGLNFSRDININSPWIEVYDYKNKTLDVDNKLAKQGLLPSLQLETKLYGTGNSLPLAGNKSSPGDNYALGIQFKYPLATREVKSKIKLIENKKQELDLIREQKIWDLTIKYNSNVNDFTQLDLQRVENKSMIDNLQKLLDLEILRFNQGESSIFIINSRENKLFDTQIKQNELQKKVMKTLFKLKWLNGELI
jgi:outer membrane protein TolC